MHGARNERPAFGRPASIYALGGLALLGIGILIGASRSRPASGPGRLTPEQRLTSTVPPPAITLHLAPLRASALRRSRSRPGSSARPLEEARIPGSGASPTLFRW